MSSKIGIKEANNEQWEWVLKQLKLTVDDNISKSDAFKIYKSLADIYPDMEELLA